MPSQTEPAALRALKLLILYGLQSAKLIRQRSGSCGPAGLLADFPAWWGSQASTGEPLADELPWIAFAAIRYLAGIVRPESRVFEYGCGGSTLFFARRAGQVVSIEHQPYWYERVTAALEERRLANCRLRLIEPAPAFQSSPGDPADPKAYTSGDAEWRGRSFHDYAAAIDEYPDRYFDVVLVDGRARPSCFMHALAKVKIGGCVLWDNSGRSYYQSAMALAADFQSCRIAGPVPYLVDFDETAVFQRH